MTIHVRNAEASEVDKIGTVWFEAWRDGHAGLLPAELTAIRTLESFRARIAAMLPNVRVVGPVGAPVGLCFVKGDELNQLFVSAEARGTGAAAALVADAEAILAAKGVDTAWLSCAIGNERAARFYEKQGWVRVGTMRDRLEGVPGEMFLETWRYEKPLARQAAPR